MFTRIRPLIVGFIVVIGLLLSVVVGIQQPVAYATGGKIVFVSNRGTNYPAIYVMNDNGSNQTPLTDGTTHDRDPIWSPDGSKIAFWRVDGIYLMNSDGSGQSKLVQGGSHTWSPDGQQIAYLSQGAVVNIINIDGSGQKRLNFTVGSGYLDWAPDGQQIVFSGTRSEMGIFIINANGSGQTRLTYTDDEDPVWSPDGSKIAFVSWRDGNPEIYVMRSDGSGETRLTNHSSYDTEPTWSPDGQYIAFTSDRGGGDDIYRMNAVDGGNVINLTNHSALVDTEADWGGSSSVPTPIPTTQPTPVPTPVPTTPTQFSCNNVTEIPRHECEALVALYNNNYGLQDSSTWLKSNSPCSWSGVKCTNGHVIELYKDILLGTLPPQIGNLSYLQNLNFNEGYMEGSIPPELGNLSQLTFLILNYNNFTGNIPRELGKLTNLKELYLSDNKLTGNVPSELGNLSNLDTLFLYNNQLSGSLPLTLINLKLNRFSFKNTNLCEPPDAAFQNWLNGIPDLERTNVKCVVPTSVPTAVPTNTPAPPYVESNPEGGNNIRGVKFHQPGHHFAPHSDVSLFFTYPNPERYQASPGNGDPNTTVRTDGNGYFWHEWQSDCTSPIGWYEYKADDGQGKVATTNFEVKPNPDCPPKTLVYQKWTSPEPVLPVKGTQGTIFKQPGFNFTPNANVTLTFRQPDGRLRQAFVSTNGNGDYDHEWTSNCDAPIGEYQYWASDDRGKHNEFDPFRFELTANPDCTYYIAGQIKDEEGEPMAGVTVSAGNKTTTTDTNGNYRLEGLTAGTYTVTASKGNCEFRTYQDETVTLPASVSRLNFRCKIVGLVYADVKTSIGPTGNGSQDCQFYGDSWAKSGPIVGDQLISMGDHVRLCIRFKNTSSQPILNPTVKVVGSNLHKPTHIQVKSPSGTWSYFAEIPLKTSVIYPGEFGLADFEIYVANPNWSERKNITGITNSPLSFETERNGEVVDFHAIDIAIDKVEFETPYEQQKYIAETCLHHPNNPMIKSYAQYAIGNIHMGNIYNDPDSELQASRNLVERVSQEFYRHTEWANLSLNTDVDYLKSGNGNSRDKTVLLTSLFRSLGIPARHTWGYEGGTKSFHSNTRDLFLINHMWTEVYLPDEKGLYRWENGDVSRPSDSFLRGHGAYQNTLYHTFLTDKYPLSSAYTWAECKEQCQLPLAGNYCQDCQSSRTGFLDTIQEYIPLIDIRNLSCYEDVTECYLHGNCELTLKAQNSNTASLAIKIQMEDIIPTVSKPFILTTTLINTSSQTLQNITVTIPTRNDVEQETYLEVSPAYQPITNLQPNETANLQWTVTPSVTGSNVSLVIVASQEDTFGFLSYPLVVNEPNTLPDLHLMGVCSLKTVGIGEPITLTARPINEKFQVVTDGTVQATIYDTETQTFSQQVDLTYSDSEQAYQLVFNLPDDAPTGNYQVDFIARKTGYDSASYSTIFFVKPTLNLEVSLDKERVNWLDPLKVTAQLTDRNNNITQTNVWAEVKTPTGNAILPLKNDNGTVYENQFQLANLFINDGYLSAGTWTIAVTANYQGDEVTVEKTVKVDEPERIYLPILSKNFDPNAPTPTRKPTSTLYPTATAYPTSTPTSTSTNTPVPTATPTPTPTSTATSMPTNTPTSTPTPVSLSYFDDFSNSNSGWDIDATSNASWGYRNEEYELQAFNTLAWVGETSPQKVTSSHYSVEVDARMDAGKGHYSLVFDFVDWENFYVFGVNDVHQEYRILAKIDNQWRIISDWQQSSHINSGSNVNHLQVERNGDSINVYVNNQFLTTVIDNRLSTGQTGLLLESTFVVPAIVRFDNFHLQELDSPTSTR